MLAERKAKPAKEKPGETTTPGETKTVTAGAPAAVAHSESEAPGMEGLDHGVGRRRGDHELHQHVEPERDDRRGPARAERRAARPHVEALGEDEPRARVARRHGVPARGGPDGAAGGTGLQPRRLRLHHLHREQRTAAGAGVVDRQGQEPRRGVGAVGQSELRGTHPVAGPRQLPGVAAARRGLRARRQDADRPDLRAAGHRQRTASRCTCATSGRRSARSRRRC